MCYNITLQCRLPSSLIIVNHLAYTSPKLQAHLFLGDYHRDIRILKDWLQKKKIPKTFLKPKLVLLKRTSCRLPVKFLEYHLVLALSYSQCIICCKQFFFKTSTKFFCFSSYRNENYKITILHQSFTEMLLKMKFLNT